MQRWMRSGVAGLSVFAALAMGQVACGGGSDASSENGVHASPSTIYDDHSGRGVGLVLGAQLLAQSFAREDEEATAIRVGATLDGYVDLLNSGTESWDPDTMLCTTGPRMHDTEYADESWVRPGCVARLGVTVRAGESVRVRVRFHATDHDSDYVDHFTLVAAAGAGLRWFPDEHGCDESLLGIRLRVRADVGDTTGPDGEHTSMHEPGEGTLGGEIVARGFVDATLGTNDIDVSGSLDAWVDVRNTGTETWGHGTRMCTSGPRMHDSQFYGDDGWSDHRCTEGLLDDVLPGAVGRFHIRVHAGVTLGEYIEHFTLVHVRADGSIRWFADEGGCSEDFLALRVRVLARLRATVVGESYPCEGGLLNVVAGALFDGWVDIRNDGHETWGRHTLLCTTGPRMHDSDMACSDWESRHCMEGPGHEVGPGETARFRVRAHIPLSLGYHDEHFGLVEVDADGSLRWFADEGACSEDFVNLHLHVGLL